MNKICYSGPKLTIEIIKEFELKHSIKLTELYTKFLLENNGGYREEATFKISPAEGEDIVNVFFGIGRMHGDLGNLVDIWDGVLPKGFIPIANDPAGNNICLGIDKKYYENIYFRDHDKGIENVEGMFFLANNIYEFIEGLY